MIYRSNPDRKSPPFSATSFKFGTRKRGNDGLLYIVARKKNGIHYWRRAAGLKAASKSKAERESLCVHTTGLGQVQVQV